MIIKVQVSEPIRKPDGSWTTKRYVREEVVPDDQFCDNDFCTLCGLTQKDFPKCTETCGQWPSAHKYAQHIE